MTASGQMYLIAVYYLSKQDDITYVADIAQALEVTRPSVSNAPFLSWPGCLAGASSGTFSALIYDDFGTEYFFLGC